MKTNNLISLHGGHSGEYCDHADDGLEDIIKQYIDLGFSRVGITEHIPPVSNELMYPDETALNYDADFLYRRFEKYITNARALQHKYAGKIQIYVGMETETYTGYIHHIKALIKTFCPDYIVGSVHYVDDILFDYHKDFYDSLIKKLGSLNALYLKYFDLQYEMITALKPFIVGHFDLVRLFDADYKTRVLQPNIQEKIIRNLKQVKEYGLVLDFNVRALKRGADEPYITSSILKMAKDMGIRVVPGDDSHAISEAGMNIEKGIKILKDFGFDLNWPKPRIFTEDV
ncbi:MAG: histidinol-phosphatase [Desulfobacteraceae bacterium]|nr:histidinol-phosphatase [Desulfobacteraceae bacterium]